MDPKPVIVPIIGIVEDAPLEDPTIIKVAVKKVEIDGRALYVSSAKDKVYDLKFKYIGRWNKSADRVAATYPDSDAEIPESAVKNGTTRYKS